MVKSKKTGRYYMTDIRKINKSIKESLFDYSSKSNSQRNVFCEFADKKNVYAKKFEMEQKSFPTMDGKDIDVVKPTVWIKKTPSDKEVQKYSGNSFSPVTPLTLDNSLQKSGPQREISTSSLSEMSSPVQFEIKEFDKLIKKDFNKIKSRTEFVKIIQSIRGEYDRARDMAISYYEKHQRNVIVTETNELSYTKIISDLKQKLQIQHREQLYCLEKYQEDTLYSDDYLLSDKSESSFSENSSLDDDFFE